MEKVYPVIKFVKVDNKIVIFISISDDPNYLSYY